MLREKHGYKWIWGYSSGSNGALCAFIFTGLPCTFYSVRNLNHIWAEWVVIYWELTLLTLNSLEFESRHVLVASPCGLELNGLSSVNHKSWSDGSIGRSKLIIKCKVMHFEVRVIQRKQALWPNQFMPTKMRHLCCSHLPACRWLISL